VTEFARILHLDPERDEDFDRAEDLLVEVAKTPTFARNQTNGLQLWNGKIPQAERVQAKQRAADRRQPYYDEPRLDLLVSTQQRVEGDLPQLVSVIRRGAR
jgi:hypothetical protein